MSKLTKKKEKKDDKNITISNKRSMKSRNELEEITRTAEVLLKV